MTVRAQSLGREGAIVEQTQQESRETAVCGRAGIPGALATVGTGRELGQEVGQEPCAEASPLLDFFKGPCSPPQKYSAPAGGVAGASSARGQLTRSPLSKAPGRHYAGGSLPSAPGYLGDTQASGAAETSPVQGKVPVSPLGSGPQQPCPRHSAPEGPGALLGGSVIRTQIPLALTFRGRRKVRVMFHHSPCRLDMDNPVKAQGEHCCPQSTKKEAESQGGG